MNAYEILKLCIECGGIFKTRDYERAFLYFENMLRDGRILGLENEAGLQTALTFSICSDPERFRKKFCWDYLEHESMEENAFIEKIFSRVNDLWILKDMIDEGIKVVQERFPNVKRAYWQRIKKKSGVFYSLPMTSIAE